MSALLTSLPVCFERKFSLGAYLYSHAELLLRSGRIGYHEGQRFENHSVIDILFKNVSFMAVAESYVPLEVSFGNTADVEEFSAALFDGPKGRPPSVRAARRPICRVRRGLDRVPE